jgi:hypothetical protein
MSHSKKQTSPQKMSRLRQQPTTRYGPRDITNDSENGVGSKSLVDRCMLISNENCVYNDSLTLNS